jgi:hypothetical protein
MDEVGSLFINLGHYFESSLVMKEINLEYYFELSFIVASIDNIDIN